MTYNEIVDKVKKEFGGADVSNYEDHLALQINITGEGEGAFFAEISNGTLNIEPYDYKDNNATLTASADDLISIFTGKLEMNKAVEDGKLSISGDYDKAVSIQPVIDNNAKPAKKTASTAKTTAKKTTAATKKAAEKAESKATVKKAEDTKARKKPGPKPKKKG